jgi:hypothetical protein
MLFSERALRRGFEVGVCGVAVLLGEAPGNAAPRDAASRKEAQVSTPPDEAVPGHSKAKKRGCAALYKAAQQSLQASRLREAKSLFSSCAELFCAAPIRQRCSTEYGLLAADVPSIVLDATDQTGVLRVDVQVMMDGESLTLPREGRAIPVEPGMHEFSFSTADGGFASQRILILQGQRNRVVSVSLHSQAGASASVPPSVTAPRRSRAERALSTQPASAPTPTTPGDTPASTGPALAQDPSVALQPERPEAGPSALPYALGSAGLAAVGVGSLLLVWAGKDNDLLNRCSPNCKPSSVRHVRGLYVAGDITIGLGVGAVGVATYLYLTSGVAEDAMPTPAARIDVRPTPGGGFASIAGTF